MARIYFEAPLDAALRIFLVSIEAIFGVCFSKSDLLSSVSFHSVYFLIRMLNMDSVELFLDMKSSYSATLLAYVLPAVPS